MSYDEMKQQHDEQMARVRAALAGNDPREAAIADLRQQLATVTARAEKAEAALAAVPVDAIGIYYQSSVFEGNGDPGAEAAQAALNAWLDQQPGWNASPELPTIREFNQSGTAASSDDYSSTDATRPVRRRGNRD